MKAVLIALALALTCGAAAAQPATKLALQHIADNDKEKGRACYRGTCTGCTQNCANKTTVLACYTCVGNQCEGNVELEAQKFCDGEYTAADVDPGRVREIASRLSNENGDPLTTNEFRFLDAMIVHADPVTSKLAAVILLEGQALGWVPAQLEHAVGEIHLTLLLHATDIPAAGTARGIFNRYGLQGSVALDVDTLRTLIQRAVASGDPRLLRDTINQAR